MPKPIPLSGPDVPETAEPQYQSLLDGDRIHGRMRMGLMSSDTWRNDPKRLAFVLSRYKFAAQMLRGLDSVVEFGCADAFGSRIVRQGVKSLTVSDFDPILLNDGAECGDSLYPMTYRQHDLLSGPLLGPFVGALALDVLEHIDPVNEHVFLSNLANSLTQNGVAVIGMPSLESQEYASAASKVGHVNCQTGDQLRRTLGVHFTHVFMFSMNDEVVHTGFLPMAHYLLALCVDPK